MSSTENQSTRDLRLIHGDEPCLICGKDRAGEGNEFCSYPHGMIPVKAVDPEHPTGFWTWSEPTP